MTKSIEQRDSDLNVQVALGILSIRENLGLSRTNFAWKLGVSPCSLKNYENLYRCCDFDIVRRVVSLFPNESLRLSVIEHILYGKALNKPMLSICDIITGTLEPRKPHLSLARSAVGICLAKVLRDVRVKAYKMSRSEFQTLMGLDCHCNATKNYENGYCVPRLEYIVTVCNKAKHPHVAFDYFALPTAGKQADEIWSAQA